MIRGTPHLFLVDFNLREWYAVIVARMVRVEELQKE